MKKHLALILLLAAAMISAVQLAEFPEARISNGLINAHLYLPDAEKGYYRGVRFDWAGVITDLQFKGHSFYGKWFPTYSPTLHDAIMGPVEEFTPLGFTEAAPGDTFVKIGVGTLIRADDKKYSFTTPFEIADVGKWTVKKKADGVEFVHQLSDKTYAYEYKKNVKLVKGKSDLILSHVLKNTGTRTIETSVYDHNFLMIDKETVGPGYIVKFPFPLSGNPQHTEDLAKIDGNSIRFVRELTNKEHVFYGEMKGFGDTAKDYDIRVENQKSGAGVRITSDRPIERLVFWTASTTLCPEPYIKIKVEPGESFTWTINYNFYTLPPASN
jgi:hypothetical protein